MTNDEFLAEFEVDNPPSGVSFSPCYQNIPAVPANLVLEGGGMRALFTAGVLDYFLDKGLLFDTVIGVSGGALSGYNYVAGLKNRTAYLNIKYAPDPRYLSLKSYRISGNAFNREVSFNLLPNHIEPMDYDAFDHSPMSLVAVVSNLETGEAEYPLVLDSRNDLPYVIASSSMPLVSEIVEKDGKKLLDGGVCDSIPIGYSLPTTNNHPVVICTRPEEYVRKPNPLMALVNLMYHDYPYFVERMAQRHYDYNRTTRALTRMHERGQCFVIRPAKAVEVSNMENDQSKLLDLYEQGVKAAAQSYDGLLSYLNGPGNEGLAESF